MLNTSGRTERSTRLHVVNSVKEKASISINQANINAAILSNVAVGFPDSLDKQRATVTRLDNLRHERAARPHLIAETPRFGRIEEIVSSQAFARGL